MQAPAGLRAQKGNTERVLGMEVSSIVECPHFRRRVLTLTRAACFLSLGFMFARSVLQVLGARCFEGVKAPHSQGWPALPQESALQVLKLA